MDIEVMIMVNLVALIVNLMHVLYAAQRFPSDFLQLDVFQQAVQ